MKAYISGSITENPSCDAEFEAAEKYLRSMGYEVVNPVKIGIRLRAERSRMGLPEPKWADYMKADLPEMLQCDIVVAIGDFWHSRGGMIELRNASDFGFPMYRLQGGILSPFKVRIRPVKVEATNARK